MAVEEDGGGILEVAMSDGRSGGRMAVYGDLEADVEVREEVHNYSNLCEKHKR